MNEAVVNAYTDGNSVVLLRRTEAGLAQQRIAAEWSFFVKTAELPDDLARQLRASRSCRFVREEEGGWTRVAWTDEWARLHNLRGRRDKERGITIPSPFTARGITMFEGDVDPVRRWFTDNDGLLAKQTPGFFDIETDSRVPPRLAIEGHARILSISLANLDESFQWVGVIETFDDAGERALLREWLDLVRARGFTQLLAWAGDRFDFKVIRERCARLGIGFDFRTLLWLDHLLMFKRMNIATSDSGEEKQSYSLNTIAQAKIGEGKEVVPLEVAAKWPGKSLGALSWELWNEGGEFRKLLATYNMKDTLLMCRIERKTSFAEQHQKLCEVCKTLPDSKGLLPSLLMDGYMLRLGLLENHHFATKVYQKDAESDPFAGAFVMEPKETGLLTGTHVADFASLYPSVIITWNMSPETKLGGVHNDRGPIEGLEEYSWSPLTRVCFSTSKQGILPTALIQFLALRKKFADLQASLPPGTPEAKEAQYASLAYKTLANSFYGVMGAVSSRFYDREIAEAVTQCSKWLILRTIEEAERRAMRVIYGDTDSFFARHVTRTKFEEFVDWANDEFYPLILREAGCVANRIKLAYEKEFSILAMIGKKRYCARFEHFKGSPGRPVPEEGEAFDKTRHSKPEVKGLEFKRGDAAVLARKLQERVIDALMRGEQATSKYRAFVNEALAHVSVDQLPIEEVQRTQGITKPIREYYVDKDGNPATPPIHVKVAEGIIAKGGEIGEGAKVSYVVTDGSGGLKAVPAHEYNGELDRYYLWENLVFPPTQRILEKCFPSEDWRMGLETIRPRGRRVLPGQLGLFAGVDPVMDAKIAREKERRVLAEARHRAFVEDARGDMN